MPEPEFLRKIPGSGISAIWGDKFYERIPQMAKRKKTIRAGRYVREVLYTAPEPRDGERVRAEKSKATTEARKKMNDKTAKVRLEMLLAANFHPSDHVVTLTYRDEDLPKSRKEAAERVKKFLKVMRQVRKKNGQDMRYVYVTESKHGEGRFHHHVVLNRAGAGDFEAVRSLWAWGDDIEIQRFDAREVDVWGQYLTKECGDRPVGGRMWVGSLNLEKPIVETSFVPDSAVLTAPPDSRILEREEKSTEYGSYSYLKYILPPEKPEQQGRRQGTRETNTERQPRNLGLELCISSEGAAENGT